jgi:3-phenylpropionate/trans-cinnamate dioxygenase ferredoxin reductase subunit
MPKADPIVIVGGGQAGAWAARSLRQEGYDDRLVLIGDEPHPPYERPPLSKELLTGDWNPEATHVFRPTNYAEWDIDLQLNKKAVRLDCRSNELFSQDGTRVAYSQLVLATGGSPRRLGLPGSDLAGVYYLRSLEDSYLVREQLTPGAQILVIGGGWIGLEVAAAARKSGAAVTLVECANTLCGRVLPADVSDELRELHESQGVELLFGAEIRALEGTTRVERARLSTGRTIEASAVVIGIGLEPSIALAKEAGLAVGNGILVDADCRTSAGNVFAVGDVASVRRHEGNPVRLESWDNAQKQGIGVARTILGKPAERDAYPWFWSDQYDCNVQLIGDLNAFDKIVSRKIEGKRAQTSVFLKSGEIVGAVGIDSGRDIRALRRALQNGSPIRVEKIADSTIPLLEALKV